MQGDREQCSCSGFLWAEKSAATGSYCRAPGIDATAGMPGFIGFFVMA
jgi:hypothetical protein